MCAHVWVRTHGLFESFGVCWLDDSHWYILHDFVCVASSALSERHISDVSHRVSMNGFCATHRVLDGHAAHVAQHTESGVDNGFSSPQYRLFVLFRETHGYLCCA